MVSAKPLAERATENLINYIIGSNMQAGMKLPNEYELGKILGVGRSTVRESVRALVVRNILEVRQGAGTFVAEQNLGVSADPLGLTFIKDKRKLVVDLMEVRMAIEPRIAALAAANATVGDIAELQTLAACVETDIAEGRNHVKSDIALHCKIAESSKNLVVPNLMPIIQQAISLFIDTTNSELREETIHTHREIINAIASRNVIAAQDAMILHMVYNRNRFLSALNSDDVKV